MRYYSKIAEAWADPDIEGLAIRVMQKQSRRDGQTSETLAMEAMSRGVDRLRTGYGRGANSCVDVLKKSLQVAAHGYWKLTRKPSFDCWLFALDQIAGCIS